MTILNEESTEAPHAGCVGAAANEGAGCELGAVTEGQSAEASARAGEGAGCAPADAAAAPARPTHPPQTLREFERALRGLGFTRSQATDIASRGFAGARPPDGAAEASAASKHALVRDALERLERTLKG